MTEEELIIELYNIGAIKFGEFTLKSGITSPIYIDLRLIVSHPKVLWAVSEAMWKRIEKLPKDVICGVPYTALPIATALSLKHHIPMVMRRKEAKSYGTKKLIEGVFHEGQTCLVIEDLITSGKSIFETLDPLEEVGLKVQDIVVLIDREQGGRKVLESKGYHLHSVFSLTQMLLTYEMKGLVEVKVVTKVKQFLAANQLGAAS